MYDNASVLHCTRHYVARSGDHRVCDGTLWRTRCPGLECPDLPAVAIFINVVKMLRRIGRVHRHGDALEGGIDSVVVVAMHDLGTREASSL